MRKLSTSEALLRGLRAQGFTLRVQGEVLLVAPSAKLTPIQSAAIRGAKAELVRLLEWEGEEGPATTSDFVAWFRSVENPPPVRPELCMTAKDRMEEG